MAPFFVATEDADAADVNLGDAHFRDRSYQPLIYSRRPLWCCVHQES